MRTMTDLERVDHLDRLMLLTPEQRLVQASFWEHARNFLFREWAQNFHVISDSVANRMLKADVRFLTFNIRMQ